MKHLSLKHVHADISDDRINEVLATQIPYTATLKSIVESQNMQVNEASLNIMDEEEHASILHLVESCKSPKLKTIIVIGIGGSNLGTKAVYEALYTKLDRLDEERQPKLLFFDTVSTTLAFTIKEMIHELHEKEEVLVNVISKSGGTMETVACFEFLYQQMSEKFGDVTDRFVLTTGKDSALWQKGQAEEMHTLSVPERVGGRFSVFTAVGIFPLALAGVDTEELLEGARQAVRSLLYDDQLALMSAAHTFLHREEGMLIHNSFFFNPELEALGAWYRQLMGESIGKMHDREGQEVYRGITPIISLGSADLHSMAQLYFGGPRDKFTNFIYAPSKIRSCRVPNKQHFTLTEGIEGRSFDELMEAILEGVKAAYEEHRLPYLDIRLQELSEWAVGEYMQFRMLEMMYLANMLNVNAFDQPQVEDYKKETRKILQK